MKKIVLLIMVALIAFGSFACASPRLDLETTMEKIYEGTNTEFPVVNNVITEENEAYYFNGVDVDYEYAIASDAMMSAIPHTICLISLKKASDADKVAEALVANADPRRWICVEVAEEDIVAEAAGATVVFIMADNSEMYLENFKNAAK